MPSWIEDSIFYHIYPLGLTGAPAYNDCSSPPVPRLEQLYPWLDPIQALGANALYLGPLFESTAHGYDTADYFHVDRRLGTEQTLAALAAEVHRRGMRLILDGVFNHVGRDFWAFRDVQSRGKDSPYCGWFQNLRFDEHSRRGDAFSYEGWDGHDDLVKLNLHNPAVVEHLLLAVSDWIERYEIDGLRLDAADVIDKTFLGTLAAHCRRLRPDFWLMGEVVHGDYRQWANPDMLDSVTNYEAYKGLYSSHNDHNYFEIAHTLQRQYGQGGLYRGLWLYTFADNHDVNRVASALKNPAHLYPLHILLFTMPGVPSIYYGSEWGLTGERSSHSDAALRPALQIADAPRHAPQPQLAAVLSRLAALRRTCPALQGGDYQQILVQPEQLAFLRHTPGETVLVAVNSSAHSAAMVCPLSGQWEDLLNPGEGFTAPEDELTFGVPACWGRVLRRAN